ncbi:MAG: CocE/NonD family hydrolase [Dehalococcoidales bacterium]|nr:CocE/NonD family hydrolase [Dehalococcoidales bacterium]
MVEEERKKQIEAELKERGTMHDEGPKATKIKKEKFGEEEFEVIYREARRPSVTAKMRFSFCPPFNPRTYIAEPGIICEQDVAVTLRDGTVIYTDIFRPVDRTNIPVILSWSMFGKRPGDIETEWQTMGVPPGTISRMTKFESADPGYWCRQGYAVANVDIRGIGHSQGDMNMFGTQDARDGYDFIEWIATQHWCNGKVGMAGNSGVAMTQWRIAAEQPPHLACIAPWEGTGDIYRESFFEGGIPGPGGSMVIAAVSGVGFLEDVGAMSKKFPLMNAYWEDKIPKWENIRLPVYTTICWNHFHCRGSAEGFRRIRSTKKWLRAHREFEWPDTYSNSSLEDLKKFFDRYLKDVRNGWELTPRVRLEVTDAYESEFQTNRPEKEFPLARTQYKKLYIDAVKGAMSWEPVVKESKVSYEGKTGQTNFAMKFEEDTEITGYMKLHMWVEAEGNDEMDLFISVRKLDKNGKWLPVSVLGESHPGAWGKIRVSHRELDPKWSSDFQPVMSHRREQKLKPGEIVPVDIEIYPYSRLWHKDEQLEVVVAGRYIREGWFERLEWWPENKGNHVIHSGGKYDSFLQIPVIPPKYQAGDYIYR